MEIRDLIGSGVVSSENQPGTVFVWVFSLEMIGLTPERLWLKQDGNDEKPVGMSHDRTQEVLRKGKQVTH